MVKIEREEQAVNLEEYADGLRLGQKLKWPSLVQQEINYKSWAGEQPTIPK